MSITLTSLIEKIGEDNDLLRQIVSSFCCEQDEDIENFLHNRAVEFEKLSKARTYLLCDEDQMISEDFYLEQLKIYGYIAIAQKILTVPDDWSNRKRKELDGLNGKIHGEPIMDFSCYLIGQLSRNSNVPKESISGKELLQYAYDVIATAVDAVGGRYMMIECQNESGLIEFYESNGFQEVNRSNDGSRLMVQMIRKI